MPAFQVQRVVTTLLEWTLQAENYGEAVVASADVDEHDAASTVIDRVTTVQELPEIDERVR